MKWKLIPKDKNNQPLTGDYSKWKNQIADECFAQCVYCSIHESVWGGIDHYHIDHYRPKSKPEFKALENDICNLFYACPVCNRFKSDDWPCECTDTFSTPAYPDPSKVDYSTLIEVNEHDYTLKGNYQASAYIIERLYLNRPQLIYERREEFLNLKEKALVDEITELAGQANDIEVYKSFVAATQRISDLQHERKRVRPYKLAEIRKP